MVEMGLRSVQAKYQYVSDPRLCWNRVGGCSSSPKPIQSLSEEVPSCAEKCQGCPRCLHSSRDDHVGPGDVLHPNRFPRRIQDSPTRAPHGQIEPGQCKSSSEPGSRRSLRRAEYISTRGGVRCRPPPLTRPGRFACSAASEQGPNCLRHCQITTPAATSTGRRITRITLVLGPSADVRGAIWKHLRRKAERAPDVPSARSHAVRAG